MPRVKGYMRREKKGETETRGKGDRDGETKDRYVGFARVATQEKHDPITGA